MSRTRPRQRARKALPSWISLRIRDAGASAYAWADSETLARVDPANRLQQTSTMLSTAAVVAYGALLVVLGFTINTTSGLVILGVVAAGAVWNRAQHWSPLTLAVVLIGLWPLRSEPLCMVALLALAGLGCAVYLRVAHSRLSAAIATVLSLLLAAGGMHALIPWLVMGSLIVVLFAGGVIRSRVGNEVPFLRPGPPPSTLPWLVRLIKRRELQNLPDEIRRKTLGAEGERSTALRLLGLQGRTMFGLRVPARALAVHDIVSLDSTKDRANLDHLVLTGAGLFVLDTKVFASGSSVFAANAKDLCVSTPSRPTKTIMPLVVALARECVATRTALDSETRGFLVIHGASVPRGLNVRFEEDAVTVEVIDQKDLIGRLDAPRHGGLGVREYRNLARAVRNIPSATGGASTPVRPLNIRFSKRPTLPAPSVPTLTVHSIGPDVAVSPNRSRVNPLLETWDQMLTTPPAPLDQIESDMHALRRGLKFEVFSIQEDLSSRPMYAMTGPCRAASLPPFVWATDEPNWNAFVQSGKPVAITRIPLDRIIIPASMNK